MKKRYLFTSSIVLLMACSLLTTCWALQASHVGSRIEAVFTGNAPEGVAVLSLAIDPITPTTIYAGTTYGVFKSIDGGESWSDSSAGLPVGKRVTALAIDPLTPTIIYAGTDDVFRSTNGGADWSLAGSDLPSVHVLGIDPKTPTTLYAGTSFGVYRSMDSGGEWKMTSTGLPIDSNRPHPAMYVYALAIDSVTPTTLYAGTGYGGLFKSTDQGENWSPANTGLPYYQVGILVIDPKTPTTLYAGMGYGLSRSTNGGNNWSPVNTGLDLDDRNVHNGVNIPAVNALAIDPATPTTLFAGQPRAGVFKSTDGGRIWNSASVGLPTLVIKTLVIDPKTPTTLYVGTRDTKCSWRRMERRRFRWHLK